MRRFCKKYRSDVYCKLAAAVASRSVVFRTFAAGSAHEISDEDRPAELLQRGFWKRFAHRRIRVHDCSDILKARAHLNGYRERRRQFRDAVAHGLDPESVMAGAVRDYAHQADIVFERHCPAVRGEWEAIDADHPIASIARLVASVSARLRAVRAQQQML